jgi:hypothetical protein
MVSEAAPLGETTHASPLACASSSTWPQVSVVDGRQKRVAER